MSQQTNRINIDPSTIDFDRAYQILDELEKILEFTVGITTDETYKLVKLTDSRTRFAEQASILAKQNTDMLPSFLKLEDIQNDYNLTRKLGVIKLKLDKINSKIKSTLLQTKHEHYLNAMAFYKTAKTASESGAPGADSVVEALSKYFNVQKKGGLKNNNPNKS